MYLGLSVRIVTLIISKWFERSMKVWDLIKKFLMNLFKKKERRIFLLCDFMWVLIYLSGIDNFRCLFCNFINRKNDKLSQKKITLHEITILRLYQEKFSPIIYTTEMDLKLFIRYDEGKILFIFGRRKSLIEGFTQIFYLECVSLVKIFIWKTLWFKTKTNGRYSGNLCRQNQKNRVFSGCKQIPG